MLGEASLDSQEGVMTTTATATEPGSLVTVRETVRHHHLDGQTAPNSSIATHVDSTCSCGQALEWCHTRYCPRCGVTVAC